jgi:DNA-binding CsgD family transcriptional regulator
MARSRVSRGRSKAAVAIANALQLYLSLNTVKSHKRSIFRRLGVSGREQALARAHELELI